MPYTEIRKWTLIFLSVLSVVSSPKKKKKKHLLIKKNTRFTYQLYSFPAYDHKKWTGNVSFDIDKQALADQKGFFWTCALTMFTVLFCGLSCYACRGLSSERHTPRFSQWPETGAHFDSLLSHSDDTASLSVERECAWCEHIPLCLWTACDSRGVIHVSWRMSGIPRPHSF